MPPFDVNDERVDDEEGAKECFDEAMANKAGTCDKYVPLSEGGTLHVDPNKNGGRPSGGTTCYYPDDDSVYFDCEETTEEKLRVCYCGE